MVVCATGSFVHRHNALLGWGAGGVATVAAGCASRIVLAAIREDRQDTFPETTLPHPLIPALTTPHDGGTVTQLVRAPATDAG